jgi:hypothetical protein
MALLQALFSFVGKSASKILTAIFGWAVIALFGRPSPKEQTLLSGLVGAAAVWPVLVLGIAWPRVATFIIAFVPLSDHAPEGVLRVVWIALATLVPILVGTVVAAKAPPGAPQEGFAKRMLRGFPITLGIATAFVLMFITVPVLRLMSAVRGRRDEHVPCIAAGDAYHQLADSIDDLLRKNGIDAKRREPSWWLAGPAGVLRKMGGKALRGFMPERMAYWAGPDLELAFYPSDILIRGKPQVALRVHGALAESLAHQPCWQTFDPNAQELERQIRQVWRVYQENPAAHVGARGLRMRVADIAKDLTTINVEYDDWQVVYRQTLQLSRALEGQPQILEATLDLKEAPMQGAETSEKNAEALGERSTAELITELTKHSAELVKKQIELAQVELRADMKQEIKAAAGVGIGGICALATFILLLVAAVFGLAEMMPGWQAALIVAGAMLALSAAIGLIGWAKRVKKPLDATQRALKEDAHWAKERLIS